MGSFIYKGAPVLDDSADEFVYDGPRYTSFTFVGQDLKSHTVRFDKNGAPVFVSDERLAGKLRNNNHFEEVAANGHADKGGVDRLGADKPGRAGSGANSKRE